MVAINPEEIEEGQEQEYFGHIRARFLQQGSVFFDFDADRISPLQMIAFGEFLITHGKAALLEDRARQNMETSRQQIQIARPNIDPDALGKAIENEGLSS